jgi:predicted nucleotide-binding protein (sugar kinase/HSP70/actin superfamily)
MPLRKVGKKMKYASKGMGKAAKKARPKARVRKVAASPGQAKINRRGTM